MSIKQPTLTGAQLKALKRSASRPSGNLCPMPVHAAAQKALLVALARKGLIDNNNDRPRINDAGYAALSAATGEA